MSGKRGRVAVIGAGRAGMAAALSIDQTGHEVVLFERYPGPAGRQHPQPLGPADQSARPDWGRHQRSGGTVLLGVPQRRRPRPRQRPPAREVVIAYGGGFIGMLTPELYERMLAALSARRPAGQPPVDTFDEDESGVRLQMAGGEIIEADVVVGADGIDSLVRRTLWGDAPKREHNLHIFGGFTFDETGRPRGAVHRLPQPDRARQLDLDPQQGARRLSVVGARRPRRQHRVHRRPARHRDQDGRRIRGPAAAAHRRHRTRQRAALGAARPQGAEAVVEGTGHPGRRRRPPDVALRRLRRGHGHRRRVLPRPTAGRRGPVRLRRRSRRPRRVRGAAQTAHRPPGPAGLHPREGLPSCAGSAAAVRDAILDRTPFLQKVVGESSPGEILAQISAIDEAEQRFTAVSASLAARPSPLLSLNENHLAGERSRNA